MERTPTSSRPSTPDSPIRSLLNGSLNIDDDDLGKALNALRNFSSRSTTPHEITCCCSKSDCESYALWNESRSKLERELVLSAEVGQALLHRHEAYVREQEATAEQNAKRYSEARDKVATLTSANDQLVSKMANLFREHSMMDKRLAQALLNLEVADASNRTLLHEIQESRATINKLSAQSVKSVGWEARLHSLQQERDDIREERKAESARARSAEAKAAALSEKCSRIQAELFNLREEKENRRLSKVEFTDEILKDARMRLDALQAAVAPASTDHDGEIQKVLETLVAENEALRHDNAELQNLLADSREDLRSAREELEEHRAMAELPTPNYELEDPIPSPLRHPESGPPPSFVRGHHIKESWASSLSIPNSPRSDIFLSPRTTARVTSPVYSLSRSARRSITHYNRTPSDPGDPKEDESETGRRSVSPADFTRIENKRASISHSQHSSLGIDFDQTSIQEGAPSSPPKGRRRQLLLLTRSRGTQTDPVMILPSPSGPSSMLSDYTPPGAHSETSSLQEGKASQVAILTERVSALLTRLGQADILTLTNRLKRQHLVGADVGHLSRTTINGILNEVSTLRNHFKSMLDDDKATSLVSRKDFRGLLKFYSDIFQELGSLRATVNEVVLNPSVAIKLREEALEIESEKGRLPGIASGALGWMAPISKLFTTPTIDIQEPPKDQPNAAVNALARSTGTIRPRPRIAPKLAPAVSASTTTVNVEFTNSGIKRAVSTTVDPATREESQILASTSKGQLLGIFAGASKPSVGKPVDLAVASSARLDRVRQRSARPSLLGDVGATSQIEPTRRFSRVVDAIVEQGDGGHAPLPPNLLQRTLRPRGLSDSSIHSTFIAQSPVNRILTHAGLALSSTTIDTKVAVASNRGGSDATNRDSVLQSLSKKMQSFRFSASPGSSPPVLSTTGSLVTASPTTSSATGTPKSFISPLPASPPKAIPTTRPRRSDSTVESTRSSRNTSSSPAQKSRPDSTRGSSAGVTGFLPSLASWTSPALHQVIEGDSVDHTLSAGGGYYRPGTRPGVKDDAAIGRALGRGL